MSVKPTDDEIALREALQSLELPPAGVRAMLGHVEQFCRKHGGRERYAELLDLVARCRAADEAR